MRKNKVQLKVGSWDLFLFAAPPLAGYPVVLAEHACVTVFL